MPKKRRNGHALTPSAEIESHARMGYVPNFKTAKKFAEAKIDMLERDFKIKLTDKQRLHLLTLKTERDINAAVRSIIDSAWR
jgi:hypothetical protein